MHVSEIADYEYKSQIYTRDLDHIWNQRSIRRITSTILDFVTSTLYS